MRGLAWVLSEAVSALTYYKVWGSLQWKLCEGGKGRGEESGPRLEF